MNIAETWRSLYEQHSPALVLYARQWGGSLGDAEDVVHDAFTNMIRKQAEPKDPVAYLFAAVRHAVVDRQRSSARRKRREQAAMADRVWFVREPEADARREAIEVALQEITPEQREVLVMKIWGELTFEAIGQVLDISSSTAASRYRCALVAMRRLLDLKTGEELLS